MTRDDIIRMAREAGYFLYDLTETHGKKTVETDDDDEWAVLERFAALVAAAEREACLKAAAAVDDERSHNQRTMKRRIRAAIRARGQA